MTVSVLMAVYNAESTIKEAVDSILNQTYTDFEFVIINDASTDNTLQILNSIKDNRLRIIENETNIGQIRSLNKGIKLCKGKYIARMDADDFSFPERLELEVKALEMDPELAIVSTNGIMHFSSGRIVKIRHYPRNTDEIKYLSLFKSPIIHISVMLRRELINTSLFYDESFKISSDWQLWSDLLIKGFKFKVIGVRAVKFLISDSTYGRRNADIEYNENIRIIKQNINAFTDIVISDSEAREVYALTSYENSTIKVFLGRLLLWFKISNRYKFVSRFNFYRIYIRQFLIILYGYAKRI